MHCEHGVGNAQARLDRVDAGQYTGANGTGADRPGSEQSEGTPLGRSSSSGGRSATASDGPQKGVPDQVGAFRHPSGRAARAQNICVDNAWVFSH